MQKSIREGLGMSVTEALWKEVPAVGSDVGEISLQIIDSTTGFLTKILQETAEKTAYLLKHQDEARKMGEKGREHVLKNFLITKHLKDYLGLFSRLSMTN